jgi:hypothetical protein
MKKCCRDIGLLFIMAMLSVVPAFLIVFISMETFRDHHLSWVMGVLGTADITQLLRLLVTKIAAEKHLQVDPPAPVSRDGRTKCSSSKSELQ